MGRRVAPNIGSNSQREGDGDMASRMGYGNLTENQTCGTHFGLNIHPIMNAQLPRTLAIDSIFITPL